MHDITALMSFYNAFDDVTVTIDDESPVIDGQMTNAGPYAGRVTFGESSADFGEGSDTELTIPTLSEARAWFLARVAEEFDAVL